MCAKTIISKTDLLKNNPLKSNVIKAITNKSGNSIFRKVADQRAFLKDIQAYSKEKAKRAGGIRGLNHHDLKDFFGQEMRNDHDRFTKKKILAISKMFIHHGRTFSESSAHSHGAAESGHGSHVEGTVAPSRPNVDIRSINDEILKKGAERRANISLNSSSVKSKNLISATSFEQSNHAIREAEDKNILAVHNAGMQQNIKNTFGQIPSHLRNFNQHADIEEVKALLAKIQEKPDNYDEDSHKIAA